MPCDIYGRRCGIIQASEARTNRMNSGGLHEMYYNDACWHLRRHVLEKMGIPFFEGITLRDRKSLSYDRDKKLEGLRTRRMLELEQLHRENPSLIEGVWDYVINFYRLVAPYQAHQYDKYDSIPWKGVYSNLANIIEDAVYLNIPPEYAIDYFERVGDVREYADFKRAPVTYTGYSGVQVTTKRPVRIAPMYWMLLEKTGDTWSAVSFAKVQQYGFLAQINSSDRYSDPGRPQPIKGAGETEFRIIVSTCGQVAAAELADRNNNPKARRQLHRTILTHPTPGNIESAINRDEIAYGGHRAVQIFHHYLNCGGIALAYAEEEGT